MDQNKQVLFLSCMIVGLIILFFCVGYMGGYKMGVKGQYLLCEERLNDCIPKSSLVPESRGLIIENVDGFEKINFSVLIT